MCPNYMFLYKNVFGDIRVHDVESCLFLFLASAGLRRDQNSRRRDVKTYICFDCIHILHHTLKMIYALLLSYKDSNNLTCSTKDSMVSHMNATY